MPTWINLIAGLISGVGWGYLLTTTAMRRGWLPTPPRAPSKATRCHGCGGHHGTGTDADRTVDMLADIGQTALIAAGFTPGMAPGAAAFFAPDRGGVVRQVIVHPDAFPDVAVLADAMSAAAKGLRDEQGQINHDTHQLRQNRAGQ